MAELGTELPARSRRRKARDPYSGLNVLRTESKDDLARVLAQIRQYIEPEDFIEEMYVRDMAHYSWDIMLYRRIKTGILNNAFKKAAQQILCQIQYPRAGTLSRAVDKYLASIDTAYQWLFDPEVKRRVSSMLEEAGLDESAIEAQAFILVADDLAKADRMLKSAEDGRDKALRRIAKHRKGFADQLRGASDRVIAADQVPSIATAVN
jgi:hypothetical protein